MQDKFVISFALIGKMKKKYAFYMALKICKGKCGVYINQLKKINNFIRLPLVDNPYNLNSKQHRQYLAIT